MSAIGSSDLEGKQRSSAGVEIANASTSPGKHSLSDAGASSGSSASGLASSGAAVQMRAGDWAMTPDLSSAMGLSSGAGAPVQAKGDLSGESVSSIAAGGVASASSALPHQDAIQRSFGHHDVSGVRAQVGGAATEAAGAIGAEAYATGNKVAFAQSPDLHTAAHEAAHVVQQAQGVNLYGGVGQAGDTHEQHADAVADAVVAGRSAEGLLDQYKGGGASTAIQRQAREITPAQITAALAWATNSNIGPETVREVQNVCGIPQTGVYDEATVRAVYAKQQELRIGADGQAGNGFCQRTGLVFTNTITNATVADAMLTSISTRFPDGVTIAVVPNFNSGVSGRTEFRSQANIFAANQQCVGVSGGAVALGIACEIIDTGDVVEVVQSIHRGLLEKWQQQQAASAVPGGGGASPVEPPAYTKVKNLALFCHGESWGMGMNASNDFSGNGIHNNTTRGVNPSNVEAFVRGLSDAVVPSVRVQLFACSTGADDTRTSYQEWTDHTQGDRAGGSSLASSMATALGPDATVSAHTTVGHTTENYAARVFGAEAGPGAGGISLFDSMYPESYVQSELVRLFPAPIDDAGRTARHGSLRDLMWEHFKDAVLGDHNRAPAARRFSVPMGQETFVNPDNARTLLYADWQTWCVSRLSRVTAAPARR
jgi:Domain of unknown function (DUF4157)